MNHGGYSTFKICPNNNIHRAITQDCLDQYILASPSGQTRFTHSPPEHDMRVQLVLPVGLVCSQCVLQWRWIASKYNTNKFALFST